MGDKAGARAGLLLAPVPVPLGRPAVPGRTAGQARDLRHVGGARFMDDDGRSVRNGHGRANLRRHSRRGASGAGRLGGKPLEPVVLGVEDDHGLSGRLGRENEPVALAERDRRDRQIEPRLLEKLPPRTGERVLARPTRPGRRRPGPVALVLRPMMGAVQQQDLRAPTPATPDDHGGPKRRLPRDRLPVIGGRVHLAARRSTTCAGRESIVGRMVAGGGLEPPTCGL